MPELPEVEVVRRDLERLVVGRRIERVEALGARTTRRHADPRELVHGLTGRRVRTADRYGKYLLLGLDAGGVLVIHLRMSGQLRWAPDPAEPRPRHTHVVLGIDGGAELRFVDPRTFGEVFLTEAPAGRPPELAHLGPDPLAASCTPAVFAAALTGRRTALKVALMDQRTIAGLGNIYSDEVLHRVGLRHDHRVADLTPEQVRRIHTETRRILRDAIRAGGSSLGDGQYVDLEGRPGRYQHQHRVYGRAGEPCRTCGAMIVRERWSGRSTSSCPGCQPR